MSKAKKQKSNNVPIAKKELKRAITAIVKSAPGISFNYKEMANALGHGNDHLKPSQQPPRNATLQGF